jgi:predicted nucleotide-binding protein (sugar kinase/HSP70/actin superfamily)
MDPELCAAQVHNQSFFFIDEQIDQRVLRERASLAIITVIKGELSAKQLEMEFRNIISAETWRWSARRVADNKYVMRFPNAKMVHEYSRFNLGIKDVEAQITIKPWSSSIGAKGQLQQAWFRVKGIPDD